MKKWRFLLLGLLLVMAHHLSLVTGASAYEVGKSSYIRIADTNQRAVRYTNGTDYCTVVVVVISETSAKMSGQLVSLYTNRGPACDTITIRAGTTSGDGLAWFNLDSGIAGACTLTAVCMGETIHANLLNNSSFESQSGVNVWDALYWTGEAAAGYRRFAFAGSVEGAYSLQHQAGV
jgi:hypothetical protein